MKVLSYSPVLLSTRRQKFFQVRCQQLKKVSCSIPSFADRVSAIRVCHHREVFVRRNQCVDDCLSV